MHLPKSATGLLHDFRSFAVKGNAVDLAVGVIIGGAFGAIVTSIVNDIVMPPIGWLMNGVDFSELFLTLDGKTYDSLKAAQDAGAATINYGVFINKIINFLVVAWCVFLLVKGINRLRHVEAAKPPAPTATEVLLTEIRDLLKDRAPAVPPAPPAAE